MTKDFGSDVQWLYERQRFGVHVGLERVQALLEVLGRPQERFETILVGGTNGKGSTAATLSAIVQAAGRRVGLFTSPHLTQFAERFLVNGAMLPAEVVTATLSRIRPQAEALGATFFEIVVALGVVLFAEQGVEIAIMEVGLGGRLDATNALEPVLSIISNVALDHTEVLGDTVEAIATEKAGILRPGRPAITTISPQRHPTLWPILQARGAQLLTLPTLGLHSLGFEGWRVTLPTSAGPLTFVTPLLGEHGAHNAALAALTALQLGIAPVAVQWGTAHTHWPGRLEKIEWLAHPDGLPRTVLLDGAHNPAGAQAVVAALHSLGVERLPLVFGAAADKDIAAVVQALRNIASEVILTCAVLSPRAAPPADLAGYFAPYPVHLTDSPLEALHVLPPGLSLVCGSLYLIGEVRPLLLGEAAEVMERWQ